jgi:hypothetical protein
MCINVEAVTKLWTRGRGGPDYNSDLPPAQCFERPINLYDHNMPHAHHMT